MKKEREVLESLLREKLNSIKTDVAIIESIKTYMVKHNVMPGDTIRIINSKDLSKESLNVLAILTAAIHHETKDDMINPYTFFTERELKESTTITLLDNQDTFKLPLILNNVLQLSSNDFMTTISIQQLKKLFGSGLLNYNYESQRDPKIIKRKENIIIQPHINHRSVKEIAEHLLNGTLAATVITLNARAGTSNSGDEVFYNSKHQELTITEGTIIDILDGFHRLTGTIQALENNPDIEFNFYLNIKNYNIRQAQQVVAQINEVNKMSTSRVKELKASRRADSIVKELMRDSELQGKVSQSDRIQNSMLVTFATLSDSIDEVFGKQLETKRDEMQITEYLIEFFNYLIAVYENEFNKNIDEIRRNSLINNNVIFAGYISLAQNMLENGVQIKKLTKIIDSIDFDKSNKLWENLNVLKNGNVTNMARKNLIKYFRELGVN